MNAEQYFNELLNEIPGAIPGKMFGALCAKMPNGKAGMMFIDETLLVKIPEETAAEEGFPVFTPMENRPMKGWYEIDFSQKDDWKKFAELSCSEVAKLAPNKKKK